MPTNILPGSEFSWSENRGWMNWRDAEGGNSGVFVEADFISGFIWSENAGWINTGDGNGPYANTDGTDFGVNILAGGDLDGFAWSENDGWINFGWAANTADANRARFDTTESRFRGYAWCENSGWINLDDDVHFVASQPLCAEPFAASPDPMPSAPGQVRYLTIVPGNAGEVRAIRVTLGSLDGFAGFDGEVRWVGPPAEYPEGALAVPTFWGAELQCAPHFQDWAAVDVLHIYGAAVVPLSEYSVAMVSDCCVNVDDPACLSDELDVETMKWGDVLPPFSGGLFAQPDVSDILAVVDKFLGTTSLRKADTQQQPNVPDPTIKVDLDDILAVVDSFLGAPYPYAGPSACP